MSHTQPLRLVVILIVGACLVPPAAAGQSTATLTFDVASVKPNKSGPGSLQRVGFQAGERVTVVNVPLVTLIQMAYGAEVSQIIGGPSWIGRVGSPNIGVDRFDVNAKAATPSKREQLQLMLRSLLADRFKLAAHTEVRTEPIWAIVSARRDGRLGPQLHRATASCAELRAAAQTIESGKDPCGTGSLANALVTGSMHVRGFTLKELGIVALEVGRRRVIDKTGLTGAFDWDLTWTPQRFLQGPVDRDRFPNVDPDGPSIFAALQEQLGLKLESQTGDDTVLVIDHVDHPTED